MAAGNKRDRVAEVRREIIGHTSRRSRDVNDRYVQIELPEKREAIRKLEAWLTSQALLLEAGEESNSLPQNPTSTERKESSDDRRERSITAS